MTLQFVPAVMLYFASVAVTAALAFVTWRLKPQHAVTWIAILIFVAIWTIGGILEACLLDLRLKTLAITAVSYVGVAGVIFFWPLFTIIYSKHAKWLNKYTIALLALIPILNIIIINTNEWHHLYWTDTYLIEKNGFVFFQGTRGI